MASSTLLKKIPTFREDQVMCTIPVLMAGSTCRTHNIRFTGGRTTSGSEWGGGGSHMENHHQKVQHSHWEKFKEVVQNPPITMPPALSAFQGVGVYCSAISIFTLPTECAFSI